MAKQYKSCISVKSNRVLGTKEKIVFELHPDNRQSTATAPSDGQSIFILSLAPSVIHNSMQNVGISR